MKKRLITIAVAFFVTSTALRADTSYLLIQGPFGPSSATETFEWQVNYQTGTLQTGQDLLNAVFGSPTANGTYTDGFNDTYNYYTAGDNSQGVGYIDFGTTPGTLTEPFPISFTLNSTAVIQDPFYNPSWIYYVAGGAGALNGGPYSNTGTWNLSNDGSYNRTLSDGSFDGWVFGNPGDTFASPPIPADTIAGDNNNPTVADFANATVVNAVPEPAGAALPILGAVFMLGLSRLRRVRFV